MKSLSFNRHFWVRAAFILLACLTLFSFAALLFHHHEDGANHDCFLCRMTQQVTAVCSLLLAFFVFFLNKRESFPFQEASAFYSFSGSTRLLGRAPPAAL